MKLASRLFTPLAGSIALLLPASGAEIQKANNVTALSNGGSWVGGTAPGAADVAVWDSTITAANNSPFSGSAAWHGIRVSNPAGNIILSDVSSPSTLTLGAGGIDMSAATVALQLQSRILLSADQTWNVADSVPGVNAFGFNFSEDLSFAAQGANIPFNLGGFAVTKAGAGTVVISSGYAVDNGTFNVNAGVLALTGAGNRATNVSAGVTFNVATGGTLRFQGASGPTNVSGPVNLNGGTLLLTSSHGTNAPNVNGPVNVNAASTILLANPAASAAGGPIIVNGSLSGSAPLTVSNTTTTVTFLRLGGNNSNYSGEITFGGTEGRASRLTNAAAGSAVATWNVSAGHTLQVDGVSVELGSLKGAGTVTNSSTARMAVLNVGAGDFSGAITDGAFPTALNKVGSGTLTLSGASSYTGETNVSGGALFARPGALGNTSVVVSNGGTFGVQLGTAGTTLTVPGITTISAGSTIGFDLGALGNPTSAPLAVTTVHPQANTSLRVTGSALRPGTFTLLDYADPIGGVGFAGLSLLLPPRIIGSLINNTANTSLDVTITGLDTPKWTGANSGSWDIDDGSGTGTANWKEINNGGVTRYLQSSAGADTVRFDDAATGTTTVNLTTTLVPNGITVENAAKQYTFTGAGRLSGSGGLLKTGGGVLRIANVGTNDYTGTTTIAAGVLELGDGATAGAGSLGTGSILNDATLSLNRPDSFTIAPAISGSGGMTKSGVGTATFSGTVTQAGPVAVSGGTLAFSGGGNLSGAITGVGGLSVTGGTLELSGIEANTLSGAVTVSGGTLRLNKFSGTNALAGGFSTSGSGTVAFAQPEQIPDTATITHGSSANLDFGNETFANATVNATAGAQLIARNGFNATGTVTVNSGIFGIGSNATSVSVGGVTMTGGTLRIAANGGPSTLTVGAGGIATSGGIIEVGQGAGAFDAVLNLGGDLSATANLAINRGGGSSVFNKREINLGAANRTWTIAAGTITNMRPDLAGEGGLVKAGGGALDLLGTATYTGPTALNAGTLRTSTFQSGTSSLTLADATTFGLRVASSGTSFNTPSISIGASSGAKLEFDLGTLGNPVVAPLSTDTLTTGGANTLVLLGAVSAGRFPLIDYSGTIGGAGFGSFSLQLPLRVAGSLVHNTVNTTIDVNILGTDTPKWSGSVSGNWDVDDGSGTGTPNWRGSFSNSALRYLQSASATDAVVFDDAASGTIVNLTTALRPAGVTVDNNAKTYTFTGSGKLSGPTGLIKTGTGTLILANTGSSDYTGPTTVGVEGRLVIGDGVTPGAGSIGSGALTIDGTLAINRPDELTLPNTLGGFGQLAQNGSGVTSLSTAANFGGQVAINAGTLRTVSGGNLSGVVSGAGTLEAAGGTLDLTGSEPNTNTGNSIVSGGALRLNKTQGVNAVGGNISITGTGTLVMLGSDQIPDTATIFVLGSSTDATTVNSIGTETVANLVVNPSVTTGQFIMRNNFTVANLATVQNGILGIASGHGAAVNALNMSGGVVRIAGNGGPSVLDVGPGGITASGGVIEVKFNTANHDATLNLGGNFTATGNVAITNANYSGPNLNVINLTDTRTFNISAGATVTVRPDIAGPGGLVKTGAGVLSLEASSSATYLGDTVVEAGTLAVKGSISGSPQIAVRSGATLDVSTLFSGLFVETAQKLTGGGTVLGGATLGSGSFLAPGDGAGTLNVSGNLDVSLAVEAPGSETLQFGLGAPLASDRVALSSGQLSIGSGVLEFNDFAFLPILGLAEGTYTLFDTSSPILGTLDANPARLSGRIGALTGTLGFGDGGNDLVLTVIPEPGSAALLLGGAAALLGLRRRRID